MADIKIHLSDTVKMKDGLRIDKFDSKQEHTGTSVVTDEFETSSINENNQYEEKLTVKQPLPKKAKEQKEIEAVHRFLPVYNVKNNTDYQDPVHEASEASPIDVICESASHSYPTLYIQVTVSEKEAFAKLGSKRGFERSFSGSAPWFTLWKERIAEKSEKYTKEDKKNLLLLLDGWPVAYKAYLEEFRKLEKAFLQNTGFKEIWFSGTTPELVVKLL